MHCVRAPSARVFLSYPVARQQDSFYHKSSTLVSLVQGIIATSLTENRSTGSRNMALAQKTEAAAQVRRDTDNEREDQLEDDGRA